METVTRAILVVLGAISAVLDQVELYLRTVADAMRQSMEAQGLNAGLQTIVICVLSVVVVVVLLVVTKGRVRLVAAALILIVVLHGALPLLMD